VECPLKSLRATLGAFSHSDNRPFKNISISVLSLLIKQYMQNNSFHSNYDNVGYNKEN